MPAVFVFSIRKIVRPVDVDREFGPASKKFGDRWARELFIPSADSASLLVYFKKIFPF